MTLSALLHFGASVFSARAKGSLTDPGLTVKWMGVLSYGDLCRGKTPEESLAPDDRLRAVFLQQGLGHFSCLVVPPQTLIDEFFILIFVCLDKDRFSSADSWSAGTGGTPMRMYQTRFSRSGSTPLLFRSTEFLNSWYALIKRSLSATLRVPLKKRFPSLTPCSSAMASTEAGSRREVDFRSGATKAILTDGLINGKRVPEYGPWV